MSECNRERKSKKMGSNESKPKEKKQTQQNDMFQLSAPQDKSNHRRSIESMVSVDAVSESGACSGFTPVQPSKASSKLEVAEYVSHKVNKSFKPFEEDISESNEDLKEKITHYLDFMDFEMSFGYHDAMILFHDDDKEDCLTFCENIEKNVVLNDKQKPSIVSYTRIANSCGNMFKALQFGMERCTFVMLYVTANFVNDAWSGFSSETCLMEAIFNPAKRWCVVPVFTEDKSSKSYKKPFSINTLKGVRFSPEEEDFYISSIKTLFNDRISVRIHHQKQHLKDQIEWVQNFEAKAREEALEEWKKKNEAKKKHEEFLKSVEHNKNNIQPSSNDFPKEHYLSNVVNNISLAQKNEQLKKPSENGSDSIKISKPDKGSDNGSSVDPQDLVPDTPSPASRTSSSFGGRENLEHCSPAASSSNSCSSHEPNPTASDPPPVSNVALAESPQRSSGNPILCPLATAEDLASRNKSSADTLSNPVKCNPTAGSRTCSSASSESQSSGYKTNTNCQSRSAKKEKGKPNVGVSVSCIDHPLSENSNARTEVHHHHYYNNPPVYEISAENVQIGSKNKFYNRNHDDKSDYYYEEQPGYDKLEDDSDSDDLEQKTVEPTNPSNSFESTPSQDGAQSTQSPNDQNSGTEKKVLQEYGINVHEPLSTMSINDPDQTRVKENITMGNNNTEDSEQTFLKEKL